MGSRSARGGGVLLCAVTLLIGCSSRPARRSFPRLDEAARARLAALSVGWESGNPDLAASLSAGQVLARDKASAQSIAAQERAGVPTDFAFDVISVVSHPLDGGATDFLAWEKTRSRFFGAISNMVELYHRDDASQPWKAVDRAYLANNVDLPAIRLGPDGSGHLLSARERDAQQAQPQDLATRYAAAVSQPSGRLPEGTFRSGEFTTGEVTDTTDFLAGVSDHGFGARRWEARPGGAAVALADGVLIFGSLQRVETRHSNTEGTNHYFSIQDSKRVNFGGLLDPGHYSDLTFTSSATVAIVAPAHGSPDVVGRDSQVISVQSVPTPF